MSKIVSYLSKIFWILLFISAVPSLIIGIKKQYQNLLNPNVRVGIVKICNKIEKIDEYCKQLKTYFEDKEIKAVLLEIDSPGGNAGAGQALFNEIQNLKKDHPKPLVALSLDLCASSAYYLACTADHIIASPAALVGSIGSMISFFNVSEILKKYNVGFIEKHSGKYKMIGSPFLASNQDAEALLQGLSDNCYEQFTKDVATCRKLSLKEVSKWADGKIFTGEQALAIGLIDETGSKYNAVKKIKELALIKEDEEIHWVEEKEPSSFMRFLDNGLSSDLQSNTIEAIAEKVVSKLQNGLITSN